MQKVLYKPANLFIYHAGCNEGSGKQAAFLKSSVSYLPLMCSIIVIHIIVDTGGDTTIRLSFLFVKGDKNEY